MTSLSGAPFYQRGSLSQKFPPQVDFCSRLFSSMGSHIQPCTSPWQKEWDHRNYSGLIKCVLSVRYGKWTLVLNAFKEEGATRTFCQRAKGRVDVIMGR